MATVKKKASTRRKGKTMTEGAVKGGNGKYHFRVAELTKVPAGTGYSTSHGGVVLVVVAFILVHD